MHNNNTIVPYISLCSGYEGIGLGLHRCIPNLRCIAYCEREAFAIANLVAKMEKGLLDEAPVFTDVTTFPWEQFTPYMAGGILSFGWPCQPVSMAGKRKATEDERWLFDIIADGISIMQPGMLFAENVEGLLSAKMPDGSSVFGHCVERLERLHYKVEAGIFSASEVGAPHQRKRVFILAYDQSQRIQGHWADWLQESRPHAGQRLPLRGGDAGCGELADAGRIEPQGWGSATQGQQSGAGRIPRSQPAPCHDQVWPSRPGQPQHGWEPLRVVANGKESGWPSGRVAGDLGGTAPEEGCRGNQPASPATDCGGAGAEEAMGNSKSRKDNGRESRDMAEASRKWGCCDDATNGTSEYASMGDSTGGRWRQCNSEVGSVSQLNEGCADTSECSEIEQPMGYSTHGTESRLGISELSGLSDFELEEIREWMVCCDNRTDELRLLGNGVVPATATRAFLTLLEKLK